MIENSLFLYEFLHMFERRSVNDRSIVVRANGRVLNQLLARSDAKCYGWTPIGRWKKR